MPTDISEFLGGYLRNGPLRLGQVRIFPDCRLCHVDDSERSDLADFTDPHDAVEIARYDDAGNYRPLKTAPNLRHGWQLRLKSLEEVTLALDFLYPAAMGTALAFTRRALNRDRPPSDSCQANGNVCDHQEDHRSTSRRNNPAHLQSSARVHTSYSLVRFIGSSDPVQPSPV